ncbi:glutathione S-transferase omega-1-like isoform X2 [Oculina patagonica]
MSHFSKGSEKPAHKGEGLRLYNMRFCPFAQRARLVLRAKGIEFESVNINLGDKPEWFLDLNPAGKVPVIELPDGKVISESAICCEFLEDMYPEKAQLCPKDAFEKHKQRILVEVLGSKIIPAFYKSVKGDDEGKEELDKQLAAFDKELKDRKSKFIGGETPSMADYLMWPWIERLYIMTELRERHVNKFPMFSAWCAAMSELPAVKEDSYPAEWHKKFYEGYFAGNPESQLFGIEEKA